MHKIAKDAKKKRSSKYQSENIVALVLKIASLQ